MVGGGREGGSLLEIQNAFDLLRIFQMYYHFNDRLPLTNKLLVVPDGETPDGSIKSSIKDLYDMFKVQNSMALSPSSFGVLWKYFLEEIFLYQKNTLTELYHNLSYETLSRGREFKFEAISDLTVDMSFQMKHSTLLNLKRKSEQDKKK